MIVIIHYKVLKKLACAPKIFCQWDVLSLSNATALINRRLTYSAYCWLRCMLGPLLDADSDLMKLSEKLDDELLSQDSKYWAVCQFIKNAFPFCVSLKE